MVRGGAGASHAAEGKGKKSADARRARTMMVAESPLRALPRTLAALLLLLSPAAPAGAGPGVAVHGGVVYLLGAIPGDSRSFIDRYELAQGRWLPRIDLGGPAYDLVAVAEGLFVAHEAGVMRLAPDGSDRLPVIGTSFGAPSVASDGRYLFAAASWQGVYAIDLQTLAIVDVGDVPQPVSGVAVAPASRRLFVAHGGPERLSSVGYTEAGLLGDPAPAPDAGAPYGPLWISPDQSLLVAANGAAFSTADLSFRGHLDAPIWELSFVGARPVVLRGETIHAYGADLLETGMLRPPVRPSHVAAHGGDLLVFTWDTPYSAFQVLRVDPGALAPADPGTPFDPESTAYEPAGQALDDQGVVHLIDANTGSVFRWSIDEERYVGSARLLARPTLVTWSSALGRLFLGIGEGADELGSLASFVRDGAGPEQPFAKLPHGLCGLAAAGSFLVVCEAGDRLLSVFGPDGRLVERADRNLYRGLTWSQANGRIYYLSWDDGRVVSHALAADGHLGPPIVSVPTGFIGVDPRISSDGRQLLAPSGAILDGETLAQIGTIGISVSDAVWIGDKLATIRREEPPLLEVRGAETSVEAALPLPGHSYGARLFARGDRLLAVTPAPGGPRMTLAEIDDLDRDGVPNGDDAFPGDPAEWSDRDADGVGDNGDAFPDDPAEQRDSDGDGVGDHADDLPFDPRETSDRDGDGTGDNGDDFPDDPFEWQDSDGDGVGDNGDAFPFDIHETRDSDGDGVGDNADALPFDPLEWRDSDGDGVGDRSDPLPFGPLLHGLLLEGQQRIKFFGLGFLRADLPPTGLGILPGKRWSACAGGGCMLGTYEVAGRSGRRLVLSIDPRDLAALEAGLEQGVSAALESEFGAGARAILDFDAAKARFTVKLGGAGGPTRVHLRVPYDAELQNIRGRTLRFRGAYVWKVGRVRAAQ